MATIMDATNPYKSFRRMRKYERNFPPENPYGTWTLKRKHWTPDRDPQDNIVVNVDGDLSKNPWVKENHPPGPVNLISLPRISCGERSPLTMKRLKLEHERSCWNWWVMNWMLLYIICLHEYFYKLKLWNYGFESHLIMRHKFCS